MSFLRLNSLSKKLIVVTSIAIALLLIVSNVFMISQTSDRVTTLTLAQANAEARSIGNEVATEIGQLVGAARAMAGVIGRGHEAGYLDRKNVIDASDTSQACRYVSTKYINLQRLKATLIHRPPNHYQYTHRNACKMD